MWVTLRPCENSISDSFRGQEGLFTTSPSVLFYFTGEFGSVMEGNLSQQDGASQKVAVKTMKCECPEHTRSAGRGSCCSGCCSQAKMGFRCHGVSHRQVPRPSRVLPGRRGTVAVMSSLYLCCMVFPLKAATCVILSPLLSISLPLPLPPRLPLSLSRSLSPPLLSSPLSVTS